MMGGPLIGNSSSGIIEAATFGCPVVNIGERQTGRERSGNVIDVPWAGPTGGAMGIEKAIRRVLTDKAFARRVALRKNVYGDGHASERIVEVLERISAGWDFDGETILRLRRSPAFWPWHGLGWPSTRRGCGSRGGWVGGDARIEDRESVGILGVEREDFAGDFGGTFRMTFAKRYFCKKYAWANVFRLDVCGGLQGAAGEVKFVFIEVGNAQIVVNREAFGIQTNGLCKVILRQTQLILHSIQRTQ